MKGMDMDVARQALAFFPVTDDNNNNAVIITYLKAALAHVLRFRPLNGHLCTPRHLGWQSVCPHCSFFLYLYYRDH